MTKHQKLPMAKIKFSFRRDNKNFLKNHIILELDQIEFRIIQIINGNHLFSADNILVANICFFVDSIFKNDSTVSQISIKISSRKCQPAYRNQ